MTPNVTQGEGVLKRVEKCQVFFEWSQRCDGGGRALFFRAEWRRKESADGNCFWGNHCRQSSGGWKAQIVADEWMNGWMMNDEWMNDEWMNDEWLNDDWMNDDWMNDEWINDEWMDYEWWMDEWWLVEWWMDEWWMDEWRMIDKF
jgi:hypothetical protein